MRDMLHCCAPPMENIRRSKVGEFHFQVPPHPAIERQTAAHPLPGSFCCLTQKKKAIQKVILKKKEGKKKRHEAINLKKKER